jgi:ribosomal protein L23
MFLHEQLFELCKSAKIETFDDIQELNKKIMTATENHYIFKVYVGMPKREVKNLLEQTFGLFDLFVNMLLKSDDKIIHRLGEYYRENDFKKQYFTNEERAKLYNSL